MSGDAFPDFMALSLAAAFDAEAENTVSHRLLSQNVNGLFETDVWLHVRATKDGLQARIAFESQGVAIPYNIFGLLITDGEGVLLWKPFALLDDQLPRGLFPGQEISFKPIPVPAARFDARIVVWGR